MDIVAPVSSYIKTFCSRELLFDMVLQGARSSRAENQQWWSGRRCPKCVVEVVFDLCHFLHLSPLEKYCAVELFERFSDKHVQDVRKDLMQLKSSPETRLQTRRNLGKQVVLRLVSCIIIAHKYHTSHNRNHSRLREFIAKCLALVRKVAPKCTTQILIRSEYRVLQTIDFRVQNPMPLPMMQLLVEGVGYNWIEFEDKLVSSMMYLVCDCYYLHREHFHRKIRSLKGCDSIKDYILLLSAAIIATAAFVCMDHAKRDRLTKELAFLTTVPAHQMLDLRDSFLLIISERRNAAVL